MLQLLSSASGLVIPSSIGRHAPVHMACVDEFSISKEIKVHLYTRTHTHTRVTHVLHNSAHARSAVTRSTVTRDSRSRAIHGHARSTVTRSHSQ